MFEPGEADDLGTGKPGIGAVVELLDVAGTQARVVCRPLDPRVPWIADRIEVAAGPGQEVFVHVIAVGVAGLEEQDDPCW